jgi:hypothetical protein
MNKKLAIGVIATIAIFVGLAVAGVGFLAKHFRANQGPENVKPGTDPLVAREVDIRLEGLAQLQGDLTKRITSAPARVMNRSGLAGAVGGARVQLSSGDAQEILLPIPQLADSQVPICYFISSDPADAVTAFRLRHREDRAVAVGVRLAAGRRTVQIAWSSVVLLTPHNIAPNSASADAYRTATSCVQSQADPIAKLATDLWPSTGKASDFAAHIQRHIREMKRTEQPRSLDALGILRSGESGICTGNANLASALMRSKGIACRSVAVIPTVGQRLEMHRIVEFSDNGQWLRFDPSSLQAEIPAKPWQNIIMAKTTTGDEQMAMKPRMGAMVGCPYGQEIEIPSSGVQLSGPDFFWTLAKPLAEFDPGEEAIPLAAAAWNRYLESGALTQGQLKAAAASTASEFIASLRVR